MYELKRKYFLDTEFIETFVTTQIGGKKMHIIDLISIGIVCEDGRKLYLISSEFSAQLASEWVKENVLSKLMQEDINNAKTNSEIAVAIKEFCKGEAIEFYGYYADYDWVVFCSLFGTMMDLPKGFPMYCKDLKQIFDQKQSYYTNPKSKWSNLKEHPEYPKQDNEHSALDDAKWNKKLYDFLQII